MKDSQIQIKLAGAEYGFIIEPGPGGLGFSSDRLLAASSLDGKLLVASKAFLEIAATPGQLVDYSASRFAPLSTDQLDTFAFADGHTELYCYIAGAFQRWDPSVNKFSNPEVASDPRLNRSLFQSSRLQLSLLNGQVVKKILIDQPASGQDWVEFNRVIHSFLLM